MKNNYEKQFAQLPDARIAEIIVRAEDYDPLAIEVAKAELSNRGFTDAEQYELLHSASNEKEEKLLKEQRKEQDREAALEKAVNFDKYIKPDDPAFNKKIIKGIAILLFLNALNSFYNLIVDFCFGPYSRNFTEYIQFGLPSFLEIVFIVFAGIKLWKTKKIGWIITNVLLMFSGIMKLFNIYTEWLYRQRDDSFIDLSFLYPRVGYGYYLSLLAFIVVVILLLYRKPVIDLFVINKKTKWLPFVISLILILGLYVFDSVVNN